MFPCDFKRHHLLNLYNVILRMHKCIGTQIHTPRDPWSDEIMGW